MSLFTSTVVKKPLNWFFARLFPSISSVSTEQQQICAKELSKYSEVAGKLAANEDLESMVVPTELPTATPTPQTDAEVQENLLREYELTNLWSNAFFSQEYWQRTILHYTGWRRRARWNEECFSRLHVTSKWRGIPSERVDSWRRRSARSWMWRSAFSKDVTVLKSWSNLCFETEQFLRVRIVNGINTYVTETSETISLQSVEHRVTGKPVVKARPQLRLAVILSPISFPERKWTHINPEKFHEHYFAVSKAMIRLLRHGSSTLQEDDGAVRFDDLMEEFKAKFEGTSQWSVDAWITFLAKGRGPKKRFQYCLNPNSSQHFRYFRAIQGRSGGNLVDPALHHNVLLPDDFAEYIYHIGNVSGKYSITKVDWSQEEEVSKGRSNPCFSLQWIRWTTIKVWKRFNTIWTNQGSHHTKKLGNLIKTQYIGAIWFSLKERDCSFIKRNRTQSLFSTTHYLRFALRSGMHEDWGGAKR